MIFFSLKDVDNTISAAERLLIASAWLIAARLITRPAPANLAAALTFIAVLYAGEAKGATIADVFAFGFSSMFLVIAILPRGSSASSPTRGHRNIMKPWVHTNQQSPILHQGLGKLVRDPQGQYSIRFPRRKANSVLL